MDGKSIQGSKIVVEWAGNFFYSTLLPNLIKVKIRKKIETAEEIEMATQNKKSVSTAERKVIGKHFFLFLLSLRIIFQFQKFFIEIYDRANECKESSWK